MTALFNRVTMIMFIIYLIYIQHGVRLHLYGKN